MSATVRIVTQRARRAAVVTGELAVVGVWALLILLFGTALGYMAALVSRGCS
jgi:hypothetical protein